MPLTFQEAVAPSAASATAVGISTIAGPGSGGSYSGDGGPATSAAIGNPQDVAVDAQGYIYLSSGNRIRRISPSGIISTFAGGGTNTSEGMARTSISISSAGGMAFDNQGDLFYADPLEKRVRKISSSTGLVTTVAGSGIAADSGDGGLAIGASFKAPRDIAFDSAGNLYITDQSSNKVRKVSTAGIISTFAGNGNSGNSGHGGPAASAALGSPFGIAVDLNGGVLISEQATNTIRKVVNGTIYTVGGSSPFDDFVPPSGPQLAINATLQTPRRMEVNSNGDVYIAAGYAANNQVLRLNQAAGTFSVIAGSGGTGYSGDGGAATGQTLYWPSGVALDAAGNLFIADTQNSRVRAVGGQTLSGPTGIPFSNQEVNGGSNPSENCPEIQRCVADPVNTWNGNFFITFNDLSIPGRGPSLAVQRTYNSSDASIARLFGYGWTSNLDMGVSVSGGVATVLQENGSTVSFTQTGGTFTPSAPRMLATLTQSNGVYTFVRKSRDRFTFDSAGRLLSASDLNGYTTSFTRPTSTSLVITDSSGRSLTAAVSNGRIESVTDPAGRVFTYHYASTPDLAYVIDPAGERSTFEYDGLHRMTNWRSAKYLWDETTTPVPVTTNHYDSSGRVDWQSDPIGRVTSFDYTTVPGSTKVIDPAGKVALYTYSNGLVVSETQAYGTALARTWSYSYDPRTASLASTVDPMGRVTESFYDGAANRTRTTDALNRTTTATYNSLNLPLTTTDPSGRVSTFTYDTAGNLLTTKVVKTESPAQDQVTTFTYGDATKPGDVTKVTDPAGNFTSFTYNTYGDITSVTDPLGNKATVAYNTPISLGWKMSEVAPRGNVAGATASQFTTTYEYDAMGRNTAVKDPLWVSTAPTARRSTATYDANGNVLTSTNGDNKTTTYTYNAANELLTTTRPDGSTEKSTYWPDGSLKTQVDGKNNTVASYTYDALGQLSTTTDALNRTTSYSYDQVGNVLGKAAQGGNCGTTPVGCTRYTYDAGDQLKTVVYSDGVTPNVTYNYDNLGRRTSMVDGTGTSSYSYDSLGRLTSTTNGAGAVMAYGYDRLGNQTSITYPNNQVVTKTYDAAGRNTTITDWNAKTSTFTYDADSNITNAANGNGTAAASTFDRAGQLTAINNNISGWSLANYTGTYDGAGRVTSLGATGYQAEATVSYSYDQVSRLTGAGGSTYGYDNGDNPTTLAGGTTQTFDAASQLLTSNKAGGTTYAYDNRGNRTSATPTTGFATNSTYDQADRTKTVSSQASTPQGYLAAVESDSPNAHYRLSDPPQDNFFATNGNYYGFLSGTAQRNAPGGLKGDLDTSLNFFNNNGEGWLPVTPSNTTAGGDTTVEILMRWQGAGASSPETLFAFESNYHLTIANGNIGFSTKADASDVYGVSAAGLDKKWVHVTAVFRNGSVTASKLYINGVAQTLTQKSGTPVANSASPAASISGTDAGVNHFNGNLDELAIWNKALTATQVAKHAAAVNSYTTSYAYNGDGLRTSTTTGGVTKPLTYDITAQYSQLTFDGENYYIYGPDGLPLEHIGGPYLTTQWYHHDVLGNTRLLTEDDAAKSAEFNYDAYGNITGSAGRADTVLKYRGEQQDRDTGYVYLRARFYDPSTTQFTTVDPLVAQTRSAYGYAINSPLNYTDRSGQFVDAFVDAASIGYDLFRLAKDGSCNREENLTALGLDTTGLFIPFATGLGPASRVARSGDDLLPGGTMGLVINGKQSKHVVGTADNINNGQNRSTFLPDLDHESLTRQAWVYGVPDSMNTRILTFPFPVGIRPNGSLQSSIKVSQREVDGSIHGWPQGPGL